MTATIEITSVRNRKGVFSVHMTDAAGNAWTETTEEFVKHAAARAWQHAEDVARVFELAAWQRKKPAVNGAFSLTGVIHA